MSLSVIMQTFLCGREGQVMLQTSIPQCPHGSALLPKWAYVDDDASQRNSIPFTETADDATGLGMWVEIEKVGAEITHPHTPSPGSSLHTVRHLGKNTDMD